MNRLLSENQRNIFPVILVFYEIANYLANDAYLPAMPDIAHEFQVSTYLVQITLTAFFLGNAIMQPILGPVSERYGRRRLLLFGGVCFILATAAAVFCHDIYTLIVIRFIQGAAITSMTIAGYATIHAMYNQIHAIKTLAWMSSIVVLAPGFGPLFGALILLFASWRQIFWIIAIWAIIGWLLLYKMMPETCERPTPIQLINVIRQYARTLRNWAFIRPVAVSSVLFSALIAWLTAGPFIVMNYFHYSAVVFAITQGLVFGSFILGNYFTNRVIERISLHKITKYSIGIGVIAGIMCFVMNLLMKPHIFWVVIPIMLLSFGAGIGSPVFSRLAVEGSDEPMGIKIGLSSSLMMTTALICSATISMFSINGAFGFAIMLLVISLVLTPLYFSLKAYGASTSAKDI